jgi:starvation-inducible DNA-binding protein
MPATTANSTRTFPTRIDLPKDVRLEVIGILNQHLADTLDLYTQSKQAHWNVKGIEFFQLHELFDTVAESIFPYVDMIAERITALAGTAMGTVRASAKNSALPEYPMEVVEGRQHLEALTERYAAYARAVRKSIDRCQNIGDASTADLLTEVSRAVDKDLYFLESHLQKAPE